MDPINPLPTPSWDQIHPPSGLLGSHLDPLRRRFRPEAGSGCQQVEVQTGGLYELNTWLGWRLPYMGKWVGNQYKHT